MVVRTLAQEADASVLCWFATVSSQGVPNVSPKEVFTLLDDQSLIVADIASPITVRNLREHSSACVSFIDIFRQTGYKLVGQAQVIAPQDDRFDTLSQPLLALTEGQFQIRHIIHLAVDSATPIVAPSFRRFPERGMSERISRTMAAYGVQPADQGQG
jgi:predicted pyridoxine 5'-phosphate oxidase superfamily flavin-nucleotide-binding protein